ncbi:DUF5710 domain-containing protein [Snodgrassella alvi]|jgi:hypothetical protein|uniref:DUF5710 domain-containing protein n=1 Tax=Snodgrassella alvi TaxID=1196083 RepID=A0A855FP71_9NEIS|nr:DUF5710 domain-containing protein [Snodgrassella alvi]PIT11656.1 hypothetical protein BGI30_04030 [Snodgrassella alvi]PIT55300.1 hypothetical protein BHC59_11100 [Snodgrassella alvi]PIT62562.1 hypothetical protein BHC57_01120 [Snodgrassella alvi]
MSTAIQQFRRDAPRLIAESLAKKQAEHEKFISYTPKKQARLKLREFYKEFQALSVINKDFSFDPIDSKTLDKFADFLTRELKDIKNPQQLSNTSIFDALWDYGDFKQDEHEQLLSGGLIEEANTRWDRDYQFTKAAKFLARALYADPPDFSKVNAKAAEREKKKEEAKKAKIMSQRAARTYLNVPYTERWTAKQHGARWDKDVKKWYLPEGVEMHEDLKQYACDE